MNATNLNTRFSAMRIGISLPTGNKIPTLKDQADWDIVKLKLEALVSTNPELHDAMTQPCRTRKWSL